MRLATVRLADGSTRAVAQDGDELLDLGTADVGTLLREAGWKSRIAGRNDSARRYRANDVVYASVVPNPSKVICVGLNYRNHIQEMGRDLPQFPTLFAKYADALIGPNDDIIKPIETECLDWEVELALIIGQEVRRATTEQAEAAIAGFTVMNDVTCRDWQFRTREWLQGKTWDSTTPLGPSLVTPDELEGGVRPRVDVTLTVDGEVKQQDTTADLLFDPVELVSYVSKIVRLRPGDVIATGTPGGVGHAHKPAQYLVGGETVVAEVAGIGRCENLVKAE